jgi:hypothetical protein
MITYVALAIFLMSLAWLAYVIFVLRPRSQAWHNRQVLRKYRAQQLRNGYGRK